ncbi:hemerythrin domain-containing protein [Rasiella sp. SM2506]|uniref:hemerythrin domain-containing protein n=1 Tax=Rasiella sp. SM2506 TaxID=3423914 RepID=UPI003D7B1C68
MGDLKPIKRHKALQPLSRQHHFGLLYSWKIRRGFSKNIPIERMSAFSSWFYIHQIIPHFEAEEHYIFPILKPDDELVQRALKEHRSIKRLFEDKKNPVRSLSLLEEELQAHIRFEERVLFNKIQEVATSSELIKIEALHTPEPKLTTYIDPFWE